MPAGIARMVRGRLGAQSAGQRLGITFFLERDANQVTSSLRIQVALECKLTGRSLGANQPKDDSVSPPLQAACRANDDMRVPILLEEACPVPHERPSECRPGS